MERAKFVEEQYEKYMKEIENMLDKNGNDDENINDEGVEELKQAVSHYFTLLNIF
jgi:hypothetical protein